MSEYHNDCETLRGLVARIKSRGGDRPPLPKADKEALMRQARVLERKLGFDIGNYNSPTFG